jgi:hypothetical protein
VTKYWLPAPWKLQQYRVPKPSLRTPIRKFPSPELAMPKFLNDTEQVSGKITIPLSHPNKKQFINQPDPAYSTNNEHLGINQARHYLSFLKKIQRVYGIITGKST